ncbi:hypothetical protein EIN_320170, partial [Entamoeba invadens IP1]
MSTELWYKGLISEGISQAMSQNKMIVIFIKDDSENSNTVFELLESNLKELLKLTVPILVHTNDDNYNYFQTLYTNPIEAPTLFFFFKGNLLNIVPPHEITQEKISAIILSSMMSPAFSQQSPQITRLNHVPKRLKSKPLKQLRKKNFKIHPTRYTE